MTRTDNASDADCLRGAQLAVREANAGRGPGEAAFELRVREARGPWASLAQAGRDLVYEDQCIALLAPPSGELAHLLAQIAVRGNVPVLSLSREGTLTRIPDPWLFRVVPEDGELVGALLRASASAGEMSSPPAVVPAGRRGRMLREELARLSRHGLALGPVLEDEGRARVAERFPRKARAALLLTSSRRTPEILAALHGAGWQGHALLAECAEGILIPPGIAILAPRLFDPAVPGVCAAFRERFRRSYGRDPAEVAACAYDAVGVLIAGVRAGASDPSALRDWLAEDHSFVTLTGLEGFDGAGHRRGPIPIVSLRTASERGPGGHAQARGGSPAGNLQRGERTR